MNQTTRSGPFSEAHQRDMTAGLDDQAQAAGFGPLALGAVAAAALSACGGSSDEERSSGNPTAPPGGTGSDVSTRAANDTEAARFLQQASFSSSKAEIDTLRNAYGGEYAKWMDAQMNFPLLQTGWDWLVAQGYYIEKSNENIFGTSQMTYMLWKQLMSDADTLRKRTALALSEFFVVSLQGVDSHWRFLQMANWWDLLVRNAFGNFRTLLGEATLAPAMGNYLNTNGNKKEDPARNRVPDENYAREILQLFTIGLYQLNIDGTVKVDGAGKKLESYIQSDVTNLARVFTGYGLDLSRTQTFQALNNNNVLANYRTAEMLRDPMVVNNALHSTLEVNFLGKKIAGSVPAADKLNQALDHIFAHPNVGPFFAKQMIQRLVTSNPSPKYVERVAKAFNNNGQGVRGDLKAVWRAILTDVEARSPVTASQTVAGKLREPMLRFVQWARTFGFKSSSGTWVLGTTLDPATQLGQSPLNSPSVFNFFRPGFVPPNTEIAKISADTVAPEFQLVNETTTSGYLNHMLGMIWNGAPGRKEAGQPNDMQADYSSLLPLASDAKALVAQLNLMMCANQLSVQAASIIEQALNANTVSASSTEVQKLDRIKSAVYLIMASSDYLVQK